jgi:hypothetical protein
MPCADKQHFPRRRAPGAVCAAITRIVLVFILSKSKNIRPPFCLRRHIKSTHTPSKLFELPKSLERAQMGGV